MEYASLFCQRCSLVSVLRCYRASGKAELAISNITRSVSTVFFVIVNSFASTTGSLVSNLIGAGQGKDFFPFAIKFLGWVMPWGGH